MAKELKSGKPQIGYSLDIANAQFENWDEGKWFSFFKDRLVKMRSKRSEMDKEWDKNELQVSAISFYDNEGVLNVNVPLEKTLKEIYMGRTEGRVNFDIVPDGQTDVNELQPSKHALDFFLDGNGKDNFWKENKLIRDYKSTYGSAIGYTGIRSYRDMRMEAKEGAEISEATDLLDESKFEEKENVTWFFFPKAIHPKDFFYDDAGAGQPDVQALDDCIYKERVSMSELVSRYGNNPAFDLTDVTYWVDINPRNRNDRSIDYRQVILYHYFDRITKRYIINANEQKNIFVGRYLYDDGKLPFVNVQHYTRTDRFIGEGIPERVAYMKAYKSEIFQDILSGAAMSSGIHLLVGNDDQIGQDWTVGGRQLNIWRTTGGAERAQQMNTSPNLGYFTAVMQLIDQQVTVDSGINPLETIEPASDKVGIVEIMEANKSVRHRSVDENYNVALDEMLTMTLSRIKQFAPSLLCEKIIGTDGKVLKITFPKIRIEGFTVEKKEGKQVFVENLGKYGYFELKPGVVQGIGVKITTPSTNSVLPILERSKWKEYVDNLFTLANAASFDQSGEMISKLKQSVNFEQLLGWMNDAFGYDSGSLKANTQKDEIKAKNLKKIEELKTLLTVNPQENAPTNPQPNIGSPVAPVPTAQPPVMGGSETGFPSQQP